MNSTPSSIYAKVYWAALMLTMWLTTAHAQVACTAVDRQNPLLYMSYDGSDKKEIWLTLHNNTTCAINVEANDDLKQWRVLRFTDGSSRIEIRRSMSNYDLVDNEVVRDLIYELRNSQNDRMIKTTSNRHLIYVRRIPSRANVRISIPLSSRKRGVNFVVPFTYDWEQETAPVMRGGAAHQVYFSFPASR